MSSHWQNPNFAARKIDRNANARDRKRKRERERKFEERATALCIVYRYFCGKIILNFAELKTLLVTDL